MGTRIRLLLAGLAFAAGANAQSANLTDLWWNPSESGTGAQIVQQGEIAFVTLFLYGANGEPVWYVASNADVYAYGEGGLPHFRGTLYRTRGTPFSAPHNPSDSMTIPVGTVYVSPVDLATIKVQFNVNNIEVEKTFTRLTWELPKVAANYTGSFKLRMSRPGETPYGTREYEADFLMHVDENRQAFMRVANTLETCHYRGPYKQEGRYGSFKGAYECGNGDAGTFEITRLEFTDRGVTGNMTSSGRDGQGTGRFGAFRQ